MSYIKTPLSQRVNDALAEAKAIRFAAARDGITYEQAKIKAEALLEVVNEAGKEIAKKYKRTYRKIRFSDL